MNLPIQNADSCRHIKRIRILTSFENGIDVYTTINVQHIESLNDIVASITGVIVERNEYPTLFLTEHQVELVDIEPDELITRLNEGKVYRERKRKNALDNFFTIENLIAPRATYRRSRKPYCR